MTKKIKDLIKYLKQQGGIARFSSILKAGFHPDTISGLEKKGIVDKISRGIYRLKNHDFGNYPDLFLATFQVPKGVVCLISALSFYEATSEIPRSIEMAIPPTSRANKISYPPVKFHYFSLKTWQTGIEEYKVGDHTSKIYSLAKTIADCFKFRNKIGINIARDALKIAVTQKGIKPTEIMRYAKICRVDNVIKPLLETII